MSSGGSPSALASRALLVLVLAAAFYYALSPWPPGYTQTATTTTTTSNITITIPAIRPIVIFPSVINIFLVNQSFLNYVYSCTYQFNYTSDCVSVLVKTIDNQSNVVLDTWNLTVSRNYTSPDVEVYSSMNMIRAVHYVNISSSSLVIAIQITDMTNNITYIMYYDLRQAIQGFVNLPGLQVSLPIIITTALVIAFIARGSPKLIGVGAIAGGVVFLYIPLLGIQVPPVVPALMIVLGLILLFVSR